MLRLPPLRDSFGAACWGSIAKYALRSDVMLVPVSRFGGRGREKIYDRKSARVAAVSKADLYIRCSSMFCRRMSMMNTTAGLTALMNVKFCSGPTPMTRRRV